ncbi:hypothetical protein [Deinococcus peraridilitoris]|nr:hypothetical protein [Deinococcus peraridilitoris]
MTYVAYEALEVTPAVLAHPELAQRWKYAAQNNLIKAVGRGRYSAVLDERLATALRHTLPEVVMYCYNDGDDTICIGAPA